MKIDEFVIDNEKGLGLNARHSQLDFGLKTLMKPSIFLALAPPILNLPGDSQPFINNYVKNGRPIAAPVLRISIPLAWKDNDFSEPAFVRGHEGRHRATAILKIEGDIPVDTYIFFNHAEYDAFDKIYPIKKMPRTWISELNKAIIPQKYFGDGPALKGPFFQLAN